MNGAVEGSHMAHPDFRANGQIFATLYPDNESGMVKLTPEQQEEFMRANPGIFSPASGAWGRQGLHDREPGCRSTRNTVGEAMTLAWQATTKTAKPAARKAATPSTARRRKKA